MFEKIIAGMIGGIAQAVFDLCTSTEMGIGFKDYDELIFNKNIDVNSIAPFTEELWSKTMTWYGIFSGVAGILILIAVILLSYKIMMAGNSNIKKSEAKDNLMRLLLGGLAIGLAPLFIKFLLFINNSLVNLLVTNANSSLDNLLGESMMTSISTGNAITTAIVIAMFIYLFIKLNIQFIVRQFVLIIFTVFTPVALSIWIVNRNATAISIWAGQIITNVFMQFVYCFLFLMYLTFLPSGGGWAVSLIWAMMILPLASTIQNSLQDLTSRIAGIDTNQQATQAFALSGLAGGTIGHGITAIKEQFKTSNSSNSSGSSMQGTNSGSFMGRVKNFINPKMQLSASQDFNGNTNPIRDNINISSQTNKTSNVSNLQSNLKEKLNNKSTSKLGAVLKTGAKATGAYLTLGKRMVEGDANTKLSNTMNKKHEMNNTEYLNNLNIGKALNKSEESLGGKDEFSSKQS